MQNKIFRMASAWLSGADRQGLSAVRPRRGSQCPFTAKTWVRFTLPFCPDAAGLIGGSQVHFRPWGAGEGFTLCPHGRGLANVMEYRIRAFQRRLLAAF